MAITRDALSSEIETYARRIHRLQVSSPAITTAYRDVWDVAGAFNWRPWGTTDNVQVSSSSADDKADGTGAATVTVAGIDPTGAELEQTVTLQGQTPVTLPVQLHHVNRVFVASAGSAASGTNGNLGDIYVSRVGGGMAAGVPTVAGDVYAKVLVGMGRSLSSCYVVPAMMSASIIHVSGSLGADARVDLRVFAQDPGNVAAIYWQNDVRGGMYCFDLPLTTKIPGGSRVWLSAKLSTGTEELHAEIAFVLS
jgi:hypothetical protein